MKCRQVTVWLSVIAAFSATAAEFHLSPDGDDAADGSAAHPLKTLQRVMNRVRDIEREEPTTVIVADGYYEFANPVRFTADDYDITIRAEHPGKVVFSAAAKVKGWRKDDEDGKLLVADLPFAPKDGMRLCCVANGGWCDIAAYPDFPRGRTMSLKSNPGKESFAYTEDIDFSGVDFASAWLVIPQEWSTYVSFVKEHDAEHKVFTLKTPVGMPFSKFNQGFRILNSRHGLRKPGMWMYEKSRNRVIYWPREGETADGLEVSVSRSHAILSVAGSVNLRVEGIVFEGCAVDPDHNNPYADTPNAAIACQNPVGMVIDGCEVRNCAGNGVFALKPEHCLVTRTHVHHVGAECINFFDGGCCSDITFSEADHAGLLGVSMGIGMQLSGCRFVGNKVHDIPACGIVMWTARSVFASNEVYRCMYGSRDGGGLYGGFNDCVLHDNYVHDIGGWAGLYADEGSQRDLYYNNRFENCFWPIHMHCSQYITVSNNVFKNESPMRFSFQGSGHGVFCDNRIYTKAKPADDPYRENCDFWGRNEFLLLQEDGSYASAGELTFERSRPKPVAFDLPALTKDAVLPIRDDGKPEFGAFVKPMRWSGSTSVGSDGFLSVGVPDAGVYMCYNQNYLYIYTVRRWNALAGYPAMLNQSSTGWGHSDCIRLSFEGGRSLTFFPDGKWETGGRPIAIEKRDVVKGERGSVLVRIPLESLDIKGARRAKVDLELKSDDEDMDSLLAEDDDGEKAAGKKAVRAFDVVGCTLKFNVTVWIEDLREEKSLFLRDGDDYATGVLRFAKAPVKR